MSKYAIVLTAEEDGRYSVSVPALPGCHTWGESFEHALEMARDAIDLYLEDLRDHNGEPPSEAAVVLASVEVA